MNYKFTHIKNLVLTIIYLGLEKNWATVFWKI